MNGTQPALKLSQSTLDLDLEDLKPLIWLKYIQTSSYCVGGFQYISIYPNQNIQECRFLISTPQREILSAAASKQKL